MSVVSVYFFVLGVFLVLFFSDLIFWTLLAGGEEANGVVFTTGSVFFSTLVGDFLSFKIVEEDSGGTVGTT